MLRTRLISAAVLIPVVALGAYLGGALWFALGLVASGVATFEFLRLVRRDATSPQGPASPSIILGLLLSALFFADGQWPQIGISSWGLVLGVLVPLLAQVLRGNTPGGLNGWALTLAGAAYVGFTMGHFVRLRQLEWGREWVVVALAGTWMADTGAYLAGRAWGRRPFFPQISPKKTLEGAFGGLVVGPLSVAGTCLLLGVPVALWQALLLGLVITVAAMAGDLSESAIKRQLTVKDSGHLIPGHGGMLDRVDSLLYVGPLAYYLVTLLL